MLLQNFVEEKTCFNPDTEVRLGCGQGVSSTFDGTSNGVLLHRLLADRMHRLNLFHFDQPENLSEDSRDGVDLDSVRSSNSHPDWPQPTSVLVDLSSHNPGSAYPLRVIPPDVSDDEYLQWPP